MKVSPLEILKQCFEKVIPSQDARTNISPLAFVVSLENGKTGTDHVSLWR